ncbi:hypothetical protein C1M53_17190 [Mesorhizobium sp. Pch-S]|nr:hypothetical protein C1M53_17190 [Mesorhizobium sp. Pch-S]
MIAWIHGMFRQPIPYPLYIDIPEPVPSGQGVPRAARFEGVAIRAHESPCCQRNLDQRQAAQRHALAKFGRRKCKITVAEVAAVPAAIRFDAGAPEPISPAKRPLVMDERNAKQVGWFVQCFRQRHSRNR